MGAGVEPAQLRLALGVGVVVDVEDLAAEGPVLVEQVRVGVEALARSSPRRAAPACRGTAPPTSLVSSSSSAGRSSSMRLMTMASASSSCLRKMYAAFGEKPAPLVPQDPQPVARLEQHGVGGDLEAPAVQVLERLHDGGDEVGAAADRLGEDDVGPLGCLEVARPRPTRSSNLQQKQAPATSSTGKPWARRLLVSTRSWA